MNFDFEKFISIGEMKGFLILVDPDLPAKRRSEIEVAVLEGKLDLRGHVVPKIPRQRKKGLSAEQTERFFAGEWGRREIRLGED